ncbi:MAG: isoprenylcysteine carboxylmethyltransferase family protein [Anaerolineaceae bacterium]|nr:MAG: isoprenylcysteine carboxylmethyltransferase family protein [Anaerolineaceae bacterium]
MTNDVPSSSMLDEQDIQRGVVRRVLQVVILVVFQAAILFLAAGRIDWVWGWAYIGVYLVVAPINALFMLRYSPRTIADRAEARGMRDWDKVVGGLFGVMYFIVLLLVAGLDERYGWTGEVDLWIHLIGIVGSLLGFSLFSWAMISNAYFSTVARIQDDRGHAVCTVGPYRYVRHPGYIGGILQSLSNPLMFGSIWSFIPGVLAVILLVLRTLLEDRMLHEELVGYSEYASQVRFRLLPGIW